MAIDRPATRLVGRSTHGSEQATADARATYDYDRRHRGPLFWSQTTVISLASLGDTL
jgi:hypothetical protein